MIDLWIHFDFICEKETQNKIHKIFKNKIIDWKKSELISRAVLTYHFNIPRKVSDSLYVCLEIPSVKKSIDRTIFLPSYSTIEQLPLEIKNVIMRICEENGIKVEYETENPPLDRLCIKDYELEIEEVKDRTIKEGKRYYRDAPVKEVLNFASVGTEIAIEIFGLVKSSHFKSDLDLKDYILLRLRTELGNDYPWIEEALHFTCNPLLINEGDLISAFSRSTLHHLENT